MSRPAVALARWRSALAARLEKDDRDPPVRALLVLSETGVLRLLRIPDRLPLGVLGYPRSQRHGRGADLGPHVRIGDQVVIPVWVGRGPGLRGEHGIPGVNLPVHHRVHALLASPGAGGVEQQERRALEVAAYLAAVRAELRDDLGIPVITLRHLCNSLRA